MTLTDWGKSIKAVDKLLLKNRFTTIKTTAISIININKIHKNLVNLAAGTVCVLYHSKIKSFCSQEKALPYCKKSMFMLNKGNVFNK